jgi:hypothetical protein
MMSTLLSRALLKLTRADLMTIHLMAEDAPLSADDTRADLKEPTAPGYAPIELADWVDTNGFLAHPPVEFRMQTQAGGVFGWFICGSDAEPRLSQRFVTPLDFGSMGGIVSVSPSFRLQPKATKAALLSNP